ncbi:MAG: hypothetical protein ACM3XM_08810 [Mycobacterium leprae]
MSGVVAWFRRIRLDLLLGAAAFALLAAISAIVASARSAPFLPLMVTLDEWAASLIFVPWLLARLFKGPLVRADKDSPVLLWYIDRIGLSAMWVFIFDLVTRACFHLGWKPF